MSEISVHCSLFRPNIGGIETMVDEMHTALRCKGVEMSVVAKRFPAELSERETIDGVRVARIPAGVKEQDIIDAARYTANHQTELLHGTELIHLVGMRRPMPLISTILASVNNIPIVSTICGEEVPNPNQESSIELWREGAGYMMDAYRNICTHTGVSDATCSFARAIIPNLEITTLPVGINLDKYDLISEKPAIDEPYILALRRLEKSKGIDLLIQAYARLVAENTIVSKLVIMGDGKERGNLEMLAQDLGVGRKVLFTGSKSLEDAIGALKCADMTVVPSLAEAGGLINTEANAVRCPLITTNTGGIKEYTRHDAAIFVEPNDVEGLCGAIRATYDNEPEAKERVENGRRFAESRDWRNIINQYIRVYEQARPIPVDMLRVESELGKTVLEILRK